MPALSGAESMRPALFGALALCLLLAVAGLLVLLTRPEAPPPEAGEPSFTPVSFSDLPGWASVDHAGALAAFRVTCQRWGKLPDTRPLGGTGIAGRLTDWRPACAGAAASADDPAAARDFFESAFRPYAVSGSEGERGLFTGYYEPMLHGSRVAGGRYAVPLYRRPDDLVTVDLGRFSDDWKGMRTAGRVRNGELIPYHPRADIENGALGGRGLEILFVDDATDAFFLHIQGSGRVRLEDGSDVRVGYAAQNGHGYFAIGRELLRRGALTRETVSMQSIRAWLADNPDEAAAVMNLNRSYIFFRELEGPGPLGAAGVPLTPERSIAVDRRIIPLGAPIWLDASAPDAEGGETVLRRLFVAQDTGGAIRGAVRGDVFWGHGEAAAEIAGRMKHEGRWYLLLPAGLPVEPGS